MLVHLEVEKGGKISDGGLHTVYGVGAAEGENAPGVGKQAWDFSRYLKES